MRVERELGPRPARLRGLDLRGTAPALAAADVVRHRCGNRDATTPRHLYWVHTAGWRQAPAAPHVVGVVRTVPRSQRLGPGLHGRQLVPPATRVLELATRGWRRSALDPGRFARSAFGDSSFATEAPETPGQRRFHVHAEPQLVLRAGSRRAHGVLPAGVGLTERLPGPRRRAGVIRGPDHPPGPPTRTRTCSWAFAWRPHSRRRRRSPYILRGTTQSQVTSHSQDWPNGTLSWSIPASWAGWASASC